MKKDLFGNLRDWSEVLETLERLRRERLLDEHQGELSRLLRYQGNWRLRQQALYCALEITQANDVLIAEVLHVLVEPDSGLEMRQLAARVVGRLLIRRQKQKSSFFDPTKVRQTLEDMLNQPEAPVLHEAIRDALREADGK